MLRPAFPTAKISGAAFQRPKGWWAAILFGLIPMFAAAEASWAAISCASRAIPVPGGPQRQTPREFFLHQTHHGSPLAVRISGCLVTRVVRGSNAPERGNAVNHNHSVRCTP
jgi:hypothetical protein